jgi:TPR repeat protein
LGLCYASGTGVLKDTQKAVYWYTKAAKQGDADAKAKLKLKNFWQ